MYLNGGEGRSPAEAADNSAALAPLPDTFAALWALLRHHDSAVRLRAVDAAEKASRTEPALLQPYKDDLIQPILEDGAPELSCHLLIMATRLDLNADEAARLMRRLEDAVFNNACDLVRAEALSGAFSVASRHRRLAIRARDLAKGVASRASGELAERARQLLSGG